MSIPKILAAMQRDFLLDLSQGFVYDCIGRRVAELDGAEAARLRAESGRDRWLAAVPETLGRTVAAGRAPTLRLPCVAGHQRPCARRGEAAAASAETTRSTRPQARSRPAQEVGSQTPWSDAGRQGQLRVQASAFDRHQGRESQRSAARRLADDVPIPPRIADSAELRDQSGTAVRRRTQRVPRRPTKLTAAARSC